MNHGVVALYDFSRFRKLSTWDEIVDSSYSCHSAAVK
jgi:hypothetical protein